MSTQAVYVKTPKGIEEVERKTHGLALKPRQVLIMTDGKRDVAALQEIFPPDMVPGIVNELLAGGFVRRLETRIPVVASVPVSDLKAKKSAMSFILYEVFGPDADIFTGRVEAAKSAAELEALALKYEETVVSMGGRKKATRFMERLRSAGFNLPVVMSVVAPAISTSELDLTPVRVAMTSAIFDAFGPDADAFTSKVDSAVSLTDLEALGRKYADVVAGMRGKKKAEAFLNRLRAAGILLSDAEQLPIAQQSVPVGLTTGSEFHKERHDQARSFMISTTNTFVPVVGAPLIADMEKSASLRELRALYYDWREVMQISSTGKARLPAFEKTLTALLS